MRGTFKNGECLHFMKKEKMEATEVYNLPISELITSVFCIEWSEDNQISLINEKGLHVFELQPNPLCPTPTAKFKRSFLYATDYLPAGIFSPIVETVLNNCTRNDMYSLLFEAALTPKFPDKSDHIPRVVQVAWSPMDLMRPSRCLLATVTSAGAIDVVLKIGRDWMSICNLAEVWGNLVKNEMEFDPGTCDPDTIDGDTFKKSGRRLVGTSVGWSGLCRGDGVFAYLVTSYRSGEVVVWKINRISELGMNLTPVISYRRNFGEGRITRTLWLTLKEKTFLILLGFFDGRIYGVGVEEVDGELREIFFRKYEDVDRISVGFLGAIEGRGGGKIVAVAKGFCFLLWEIDELGEIRERKWLKLSGFPITGVVLIDRSQALLSSQDASLHHINLEAPTLTSSRISHDMRATKVQYLGLARSPSGSIFLNVTSPNTIYDHLVCREPCNILMFTLNQKGFDLWERLTGSDKNLNIYWECLEMIRIRAARAPDAEALLPKIPEELESHSVSVHNLRITMWLTLITEVVKKKKVIKKIDNVVGEISEAQPLIFLCTASSHLIKLSKKKDLTDDNRLSIHFLRLYIEVFLAGEEDDHESSAAIKYAQEAIKATSDLDLIQAEPCNLCGEILTELPWNTSSCPRGHQLPRCAISLLQITSLKYRSCSVCGRIFHSSLEDDYEEIKCLYCDVPAVYDTRILGVFDQGKKLKNLSLRPSWDVLVVKGQEEGDKKGHKVNEEELVTDKGEENVTES